MSEEKVLDLGYLKLIETWGSDERVIESARMSTAKGFQGWPQDEKLLRYLWENRHHSTFEMGGMTIEVEAPIFVFREWMRSRTQSYNEMSARYVELPELFYVPNMERLRKGGQAKKNKQSSGEELSDDVASYCQAIIIGACEASFEAYRQLIEAGLSREIARVVLPVNTYSRMRASANLRNWLHFLDLRMDEAAQWEIRQYANAAAKLIQESFPRTYALFEEGRK